jgi:hypothetical protein
MRYGVDTLPHAACAMCVKKGWSVLGARRQNLPRLRVEKLGCLISTCGSSCPVALGLFTRWLRGRSDPTPK